MHELDIRYVLLDMFFIISEVKGGEVGITSCKHLHAILIGRIWLLKVIVNLCKCIPEKNPPLPRWFHRQNHRKL